ncbi:MAG: type II toxin-antitoxin system Phd/YefM family antitoxin [bacterium]
MKQIGASDFKARCLALIDDVNATGSPVVITKRGQPVAELVRYSGVDTQFPQHTLRDSVSFYGDVEQPIIPSSDWDVVAE